MLWLVFCVLGSSPRKRWADRRRCSGSMVAAGSWGKLVCTKWSRHRGGLQAQSPGGARVLERRPILCKMGWWAAPTEAEWEHAARAGQGDVRFPWGAAEPNDTDITPCNIWQGRFPKVNTCVDGFTTTAPVCSFEPNPWGLYNLIGNVWEWTADPYRIRSLKTSVKTRLSKMKGYKTSKGGSFLCHRSYCYRYRIAARSGISPDSSTSHQGFRVVWPT